MDGILLVDKPKGWTSFDVVAKVRGILKHSGIVKPKVGHTGTLDPMATGLLVLVLGNYTKQASEFSKLDKVYEATLKLGETSSTGDEEGEKLTVNSKQPTTEQTKNVLRDFVGEIEQTPPAYSAIKVNGQRAYKLARAGKEFELKARRVTVYSIQLTDYSYPIVKLTAKVSSGTYIRTLAEDIGQKLGTGAYLTDLKRTKVGKFDIEDAVDIVNLEAQLLTPSS